MDELCGLSRKRAGGDRRAVQAAGVVHIRQGGVVRLRTPY
jgi:hypothetical protein